MNDQLISLSAIDEERFGVRTAKAFGLIMNDLQEVLSFCEMNKVQLLIARCPTTELHLVQEMEHQGFLLMDTLLCYACDLRQNPPPEYVSELTIRPFRKGEEQIIQTIAGDAFAGYLGHYHADSRLDKAKCDEVYVDWSYRSCISRDVADEVFVAEQGGRLIGYGTVRAKNPEQGQYIIGGILKEYQGMGAIRLIVLNCMRWCIERNIRTMTTETQVTNTASQKVWIRLGFEQNHSYYTFHKWFS